MRISDWSSDVCSSDLPDHLPGLYPTADAVRADKQPVDLPSDAAWRRLQGDRQCVTGYRAGQGALSIQGFESLRSEEHTSELQSLMRISYAVFCLKKKNTKKKQKTRYNT